MRKIKDELWEIINSNSMLKFGLHHRLLNISKLADFLKPLIEIRTKKDLRSPNALIMALSRLQREKIKTTPKLQKFTINNLSITSDLCAINFPKTPKLLHSLGKIYDEAKKNNHYITLSQGINEITIISKKELMPILKKLSGENYNNYTEHLAALGVSYDEKYFNTPGLLYFLLQQISLQGINIYEVSSTYTETVFYVHQKDIKLLFDTIHQQFK